MSNDFQLALKGGQSSISETIKRYQSVRAEAAKVGEALAEKEKAYQKHKADEIDKLSRKMDEKYYKSVGKEHQKMATLHDTIEEYQFLARRQYKKMYNDIMSDFTSPREEKRQRLAVLRERYEAAVHPDDAYTGMIQNASSVSSLQNMVEQMFMGVPGSHGHAVVLREGTGMVPYRREYRW